ncbi:MAG: DUF2285 domain-containing protein [Paenirhodobacter sp.]|uniref:hypothetical protein n=1 Tax=Paenirhodobacter sp. TaxID=1965326 RepID=UPI003D10038C
MRDPAKEWGLPDWRDAGAYGDTAAWSLERWFWEFLRRRDDLRTEFDEKKDQKYQDSLLLWKRDNSVSPDGVKTPYKAGFSVGTRKIYPESHIIEHLPNPRIGDQPYYALPRLYDRALTQVGKKYIGPDEKYFRVDFDLDMPIRPQIEEAEKALKEFQIHRNGKTIQKRRHTEKWLTYLRVLDARECGASWSEIATILPMTAGTEQTARDTWEQARALCFNF